MLRTSVMATVVICLASGTLSAREWARKMFTELNHDFGTVARGSKTEHLFELQNIYKETIHIAGVRASCGCASASIVDPTLKTWEKSGILVKFNTRSFIGNRKATITVTIDRPYFAEVQLTINGLIRSDVVIDPGIISFDSVEYGAGASRVVNVTYAGRSDWKILDVRSANANFAVDLNETQRLNGRVGYEMIVHLGRRAPAGYLNDQMILVTNDRRAQHIPIRIEGNVLSRLTVSPASLSLGVVRPGDTITKNIVVRAKDPFKIIKVRCEDDCFEVTPTTDAKRLHVVPVRFTAGAHAGKIAQRIEIETDMGPGTIGKCVATATIKEYDNAVQVSN